MIRNGPRRSSWGVISQSPRRCLAGESMKRTSPFSYQHKGMRPTQSDFDGTMNLIFDLRGGRLQGKYYTNRPSLVDDDRTSHGHVILFKLTNNLISSEEAFASFIENTKLLSSTVAFVLDMAETGAPANDTQRIRKTADASARPTTGASAPQEASPAESQTDSVGSEPTQPS